MDYQNNLLRQLQQPATQKRIKALEHKYFCNIQFQSYNYYESIQEYTLGFEYNYELTDEDDAGNPITWVDSGLDDLVFQSTHLPLDEDQTLSSIWLEALLQQLAKKAQDMDEGWTPMDAYY